jgi:hypothetical protein
MLLNLELQMEKMAGLLSCQKTLLDDFSDKFLLGLLENQFGQINWSRTAASVTFQLSITQFGHGFSAKLNKELIICLLYLQIYRRSVHFQDGARFGDGRCPGE